MSDVLENYGKCDFEIFSPPRLLGRGKKFGENFGSEGIWEAKKRPGAIFDHRKPIGSRGIGIRKKITYLNSK